MCDLNSRETVRVAELQEENQALSQQVKNLVKAEGRLYEYQEKLDVQLNEYKTLYELSRKINATFDLATIFTFALEYVIRNLEYERVIFLRQFEDAGDYVVCAQDGFYDPQEMEAIAGLTISQGEPPLRPLLKGGEYLVCKGDSGDPPGFRARLRMHEYLIYPLGSQVPPLALMAVGNSAENAEFYRRVSDGADALVGMGNLVGLLSSRVDNYISYVSMEKALEQERRAEAKYRGIFKNAAEGIVQVSGDGGILSCNPAAAAILDYGSPEEMIESVTDFERQLFVKPDLGKGMSDRLRQGLKVTHLEVEFYRKDGSRQWVRLSVSPVLTEEGEVLTLDCMILDIAERKRAEMALQHLNEELEQRVTVRTGELEQANLGLHTLTEELETAFRELKSAQSRILQQEKMASIGQLAAGVAHEINNPMGFIISNLNSFSKYTGKITTFMQIQAEAVKTLEEDYCASAVVENLQKQKKLLKLDYVMEDLNLLIGESMEGAERIKRIVQNLKSFSRLDDTEFKMTEINAGIESTINIVWNEIRHKAVLNKELGDIPAIYCNLGQLNQVFMNLLVNAAQAMDSQGEITVKTSRDDKNVYIAVSDTGKGIPEDKLNRIFEPFFTTKEVGQGTGLGLSIAYDIVRQHHGVIHVESEVGKGTTFTISLPIANPMAAQA